MVSRQYTVFVGAGLVGLIGLIRHYPDCKAIMASDAASRYAKLAEVAAQEHFTTLDDFVHVEESRRTIADYLSKSANLDVERPLSDADRAQLSDIVASHLYYLFVENAAEYINWRSTNLSKSLNVELALSNVYVQRLLKDPEENGEAVSGLSTQSSAMEVWTCVHDAYISLKKGKNAVVAVGVPPGGSYFRRKREWNGSPVLPHMPDELVHWEGPVSARGYDIWGSVESAQEIFDMESETEVVGLTVLVECADGTRRPWTWNMYLDANANEWRLFNISQNNVAVGDWAVPPPF